LAPDREAEAEIKAGKKTREKKKIGRYL